MASCFDLEEVLQRLDDDDFGLSSDDESDFEGDGVVGYLPEVQNEHLGEMTGGGSLVEETEHSVGAGSKDRNDSSPRTSASPFSGQ